MQMSFLLCCKSDAMVYCANKQTHTSRPAWKVRSDIFFNQHASCAASLLLQVEIFSFAAEREFTFEHKQTHTAVVFRRRPNLIRTKAKNVAAALSHFLFGASCARADFHPFCRPSRELKRCACWIQWSTFRYHVRRQHKMDSAFFCLFFDSPRRRRMISFSSAVRDATTAQSYGTRFSAGGEKCDFFALSFLLCCTYITRVIKPTGYSTWLWCTARSCSLMKFLLRWY